MREATDLAVALGCIFKMQCTQSMGLHGVGLHPRGLQQLLADQMR